MSKIETKETENFLKDELYGQYNWFYNAFFPAIQHAAKDFHDESFIFNLTSVSKNINVLMQGDEYFVTKIRIDKQHDVFFRCSSDAVKIILNNILGESKKFNLSKTTELEAKLISAFNDNLYNHIIKFLLPPPPKTQKRKNIDAINLSFFIKDKHSDTAGKIIISLPQVLLAPKFMDPPVEQIDISRFRTSRLDVKIKVGTTKFPLKEIKNLEKEDIVIFENSDIHTMKIIYKDFEKDFKLRPNPGLITSIDNNDNGGHNMEEKTLSQSLWDNIQVEMGAEFDKVKITLGELKNIEQGSVVDIASVYENKIALTVENKVIAKGELVIINDRYGVRIEEVFASEKNDLPNAQVTPTPLDIAPMNTSTEEILPQSTESAESSDEEFDYSDFELDDEDI